VGDLRKAIYTKYEHGPQWIGVNEGDFNMFLITNKDFGKPDKFGKFPDLTKESIEHEISVDSGKVVALVDGPLETGARIVVVLPPVGTGGSGVAQAAEHPAKRRKVDPVAVANADKQYSQSLCEKEVPENWDTLDGFRTMLDADIPTMYTDSEVQETRSAFAAPTVKIEYLPEKCTPDWSDYFRTVLNKKFLPRPLITSVKFLANPGARLLLILMGILTNSAILVQLPEARRCLKPTPFKNSITRSYGIMCLFLLVNTTLTMISCLLMLELET
jgi:hypothetical protein